ncbi:MAG: outer membrane beta-barrel domain-containing protein [Gammaproteobacteria bacterium]|nr:outer membrane beta-barrel domain-containing protein [Gammaproteobacteria bacterium]
MVSRCRQLLLNLVLPGVLTTTVLMSSVCLAAEPEASGEQVIKPELSRRDVKLPDIDTENFEIGVYTGTMSVEDFGVNPVQGLRVAYHLTEDVFLELSYGKTTTTPSSVERVGPFSFVDDRDLTYYNLLLGYNLLPGEVYWGADHAFNTDLYVVLGSGSTKFDGEDRSTLVVGFGYRFLASDWMSLRLDMRRHTFETDIFGEAKQHNNLEFLLGVAVFF